ncbi:Meiotically up-regulated protein 86 protein [Malassezia pachydermatis]|uniref:Gpr fun34 family protein n=1 Tax=Malassezia pachydermatis TaxID=77020 RepID=A0A0M9VPA3_9BASI|nr:gpr fun34 family protein [Malassezia pachydermatis]KOS14223.1 gpr fun34 family protein [Malassezia pachydermatis]
MSVPAPTLADSTAPAPGEGTVPVTETHTESKHRFNVFGSRGGQHHHHTTHLLHHLGAEHQVIVDPKLFGFGPLSQVTEGNGESLHRPFPGELQPGLFRSVQRRRLANPSPMGLMALGSSMFILSILCMGTLSLTSLASLIAVGFGLGGLIMILSSMWEMAVGNTFGATVMATYGGFWISYAIIQTPGGFHIVDTISKADGVPGALDNLGLFFMVWFVVTFIFFMCTLRSTVMLCLMFFLLDIGYLLVGCAYLRNHHNGIGPHLGLLRAGGAFCVLGAINAWYNAYVGMIDNTNSFFLVPEMYFPWTAAARQPRETAEELEMA